MNVVESFVLYTPSWSLEPRKVWRTYGDAEAAACDLMIAEREFLDDRISVDEFEARVGDAVRRGA